MQLYVTICNLCLYSSLLFTRIKKVISFILSHRCMGMFLESADDECLEAGCLERVNERESSSDESDMNLYNVPSPPESENEHDNDTEYYIFPLALDNADPMCRRLNELIASGKIPKDRILYKFLDDITNVLINPNHPYDEDVLEFFNSVQYLGGKRTVNFIRGPMLTGTGQQGMRHELTPKINLGGPARTTRHKVSPGYTTDSGIIKPWLATFIELANADGSQAVPIISTPVVKVFSAALQNDGTALKSSIQFDEKQQVNIGLKHRVDLEYVKQHSEPNPEYLKANVITEVNVDFLTLTDDTVSFPAGVHYFTKAGKTGNEMKAHFLTSIGIIQTCQKCLGLAVPVRNIIHQAAVSTCDSSCPQCIDESTVCIECRNDGQTSHIPSLRACTTCIQEGSKCVRVVVLVLATDCETGNKKALEMISQDRQNGTQPAQFIFSPLPDAIHVGKSIKASFANWLILLDGNRSCLSMLRTLRDNDHQLKKMLPRDSVTNKDRMDWTCILKITDDTVRARLQHVSRVVHTLVPDKYRISPSNKPGLYPHPVAISVGEQGRLLMLDYKPMERTSRLLEVTLHVPCEVTVLGEFGDARSLAYVDGIAYICNHSQHIAVYPVSKSIKLKVNMKKEALLDHLSQRGLSTVGTVNVLKQRLTQHLQQVEQMYKNDNIDTNQLVLSNNIYPCTLTRASDSLIICCSDVHRKVYNIQISSDGVAMKGSVSLVCNYPDGAVAAKDLCVATGNNLCVSFSGESGGVSRISLETGVHRLIIQNGTALCQEAAGVTPFGDKLIFCDVGTKQLKVFDTIDSAITVFAGNGVLGNDDGDCMASSFSQPVGVACEHANNVYVVDAQTGCLKLISNITGIVNFLFHLKLLYRAFSVHQKKTQADKLPLNEAIHCVQQLLTYLEGHTREVQKLLGTDKKTNGPEGTVADRTIISIRMILQGLQQLRDILTSIQTTIQIDLYSCLTTDCENFHAIGHLKDDTPTLLQYAKMLASTVHESVKRVTPWSVYYFTSPDSYYPIPGGDHRYATKIHKLSKPPHNAITLTQPQIQQMRGWANEYGRCVRQRSVRQDNTKFRAGTLPLYMYRTTNNQHEQLVFADVPIPERQPPINEEAVVDQPLNEGAVVVDQPLNEGAVVVDQPLNEGAVVDQPLNEGAVVVDHPLNEGPFIDQVSEYDTDSDNTSSSDEASMELTFMRGIQTRSGRCVKIKSFL